MYVAAKDEAAEAAESGETEPVIVPTDPPEFNGCLKQIRQQIPSLDKTAKKTLVADCASVFKTYSNEVLTFLIEGYWYQATAYKDGIRYTDADLAKAFAKAKKSEFPTEAEFKAYLKSSGETEADVKFQIRVNAIYAKLLKRHEKTITAAAITAYYNAHKSSFGTQATADIHLVRTTSQAKAQAALNDLKSGQSWDAVAKQYSEDATAKTDGGVLTGVTNGQEESAVNKVIFSSPVNKLEGPIHGVFGWYVLEVTQLTKAVQESLAKATPTVKTDLTTVAQTKAEAIVSAQSKKLWLHLTTCRAPHYLVTSCSNYVAPKTTTTATATPTTATTTAATTTTAASTGTTTAASTTTTSAR
jgi:foldase protein PrsA